MNTQTSDRAVGAMGWQPDIPDFRDYTVDAPQIGVVLARSKPLKALTAKKMPAKVDLREWCSPVEDQGDLGSCTANAGVGLLEYYERRAFGRHLDASRLFLYKATRNLLGWTGDRGATLRSTMKAMVLFGVPPEQYWTYDEARFDHEPAAFLYAFAQSYQSLKYYRLDPPGTSPDKLVQSVKKHLAAGLPSMFGFTVYDSIPAVGAGTGDIPLPKTGERVLGGHAIDAVGYDDAKKIGKEKGALLIRNSWGTGWGESGYGWMPYAYIEMGLADDFWSLVRAEFVDTDLFK